jgi:hypothetical protein
MTSPQTLIAIDLSAACRACRAPVPLNALVKEVACTQCRTPLAIDAATWQLLLEEPAREGPGLAEGALRSGALPTTLGVFQRAYRRVPPACGACGTSVSGDRFDGTCGGCGAPIASRPLPAGMSVTGVSALVLEDPGAFARRPARTEPAELHCPSCGAGLRFDGSTRQIACGHCRASVVVPDELWSIFWPTPIVRTWWLACEARANAAPPAKRETLEWQEVLAAGVDPAGNVYLVAEDSKRWGTWFVASLDAGRALRWVRPLPFTPEFDDTLNRNVLLGWFPSGHLAIGCRGKRPLHVLQGTDGAPVATVGTPTLGPQFSLAGATSFAVDLDGTILVVDGGNLVRWSSRGERLSLWQGRSEQALDLGTQAKLEFPIVHVAPDGTIYATSLRHSRTLVALGRAGETRAKAGPIAFVGQYHGLWSDQRGHVYLSEWARTIRYAPGLVSREPWIEPPTKRGEMTSALDEGTRLQPTVSSPARVREENLACVAPDGTAWVFGRCGLLRCVSPDGRIAYVSPASQKDAEGALTDGVDV